MKMFRCKKCGSIDKFELILSPDYKGKGEYSETRNQHDEIIINVDGYVFIPDLSFMGFTMASIWMCSAFI